MKDRFGLHKAYTDETSLMSRKLDIVSDFCGGGILLDIGCGTGEFISRVKSKFASIIGIDLDDGLLKFSSQRFNSIKKIKILKLGVESIRRFGRNKFDFVTALDVIEHLDDPKSALRNIYSVLKPDGRFLMTTPNWPDKVHIRFDKNSPHKSAHSSFGWKKMVENSGFSVEIVRTIRFPLIDSVFLNKRFHLFRMCVLVVARKPNQCL